MTTSRITSQTSAQSNTETLAHFAEFFQHPIRLRKMTDKQFSDGAIYAVEFLDSYGQKFNRGIASNLNRTSQQLFQKDLFSTLNGKACISLKNKKIWDNKIGRVLEKKNEVKRRGKAAESPMQEFIENYVFAADQVYSQWYQLKVQSFRTVESISKTAERFFGMPAKFRHLENAAKIREIIDSASDKHNFIFFTDSTNEEDIIIFVNAVTMEAWNRAIRKYPIIDTYSAIYSRLRQEAKKEQPEGSNEKISISSEEVMSCANQEFPRLKKLRRTNYWDNFVRRYKLSLINDLPQDEMVLEDETEAMEIESHDYTAEIFTESKRLDKGWYELRVPVSQANQISKKLMEFAEQNFEMSFTRPSYLSNKNYLPVRALNLFNTQDRDSMYFYYCRGEGAIYASEVTAKAWNKGVNKRLDRDVSQQTNTIMTENTSHTVPPLPISEASERRVSRKRLIEDPVEPISVSIPTAPPMKRRNIIEDPIEITLPPKAASVSTPSVQSFVSTSSSSSTPVSAVSLFKPRVREDRHNLSDIVKSLLPKNTQSYLADIFEGEIKLSYLLKDQHEFFQADEFKKLSDPKTKEILDIPVKFKGTVRNLRCLLKELSQGVVADYQQIMPAYHIWQSLEKTVTDICKRSALSRRVVKN